MKKFLLICATAILMSGCQNASAPSGNQTEADIIHLNKPESHTLVQTPLTIEGEAKGPWFFEGSFPFLLKDSEGKVLAESYAQAKGEWMTEEFVPFTGQITFETPSTTTGELWLIKDNPSGLPEHDDHRVIPVSFE